MEDSDGEPIRRWRVSHDVLDGSPSAKLLDHIIPLSERYLHRLLTEYLDKYYHPVRTHSSLDHKPPDADPLATKRRLSPDDELESEPILGGLYTDYRAKAA